MSPFASSCVPALPFLTGASPDSIKLSGSACKSLPQNLIPREPHLRDWTRCGRRKKTVKCDGTGALTALCRWGSHQQLKVKQTPLQLLSCWDGATVKTSLLVNRIDWSKKEYLMGMISQASEQLQEVLFARAKESGGSSQSCQAWKKHNERQWKFRRD